MKTVNETFSTEEHAYMMEIKGSLTWRKFILRGAELIKLHDGVKSDG